MGKIAFLITLYLVFNHALALVGTGDVLKTIQSEDGDIIDCVDIYKQPAFDHPALKNHTIKMAPTSYPAGIEEKAYVEKPPQLWIKNGRCPDGTIPILNAQKHELLNSDSLKRNRKKYPQNIDSLNFEESLINQYGHEHAVAYLVGDKYYGAQATYNVWNPKVATPSEFSLAQLWLLSGGPQELNTIEAGWMVHPQLFGDYNTHLFAYWTRDDYGSTGCYNLECPGFVQIRSDIALGATLKPASTYASNQYEITLLVFKDQKTGDWWLRFQDKLLGYWPGALFTHLADSADTVEWGGEVVNSQPDGHHTTTQMGSGHFPGEGFEKSSFIRNIQTIDASNTLHNPHNALQTRIEQPSCYDLQLIQGKSWGSYCYLGGPGQNPNCP